VRPIDRGASPQTTDYADYRDAFPDLSSRLGSYCSFCERRIPTNLAVEHVQPKGLPQYAPLVGRWDNFLLACVNCNSTKKDKDVVLPDVILPDRDNTAYAFVYDASGKVAANPALPAALQAKADATLGLCGLDKAPSRVRDANGNFVAIDRYRQRMDVWAIAARSKELLGRNRSPDVIELVRANALAHGHFSVWMTVFAGDVDVRRELVAHFKGTDPGCFDPVTTHHVSPRPASVLPHGAKC